VLFRQPETALITHYPPDFELADHETALDGMTDGVIADVNAIPLRKGVISAQGASGREYVAQTKDRTLWIWGRVFLVNRRGFVVRAVSANHGTETHRLASERFMKSFRITDLTDGSNFARQ
jgi:hypothetical protein